MRRQIEKPVRSGWRPNPARVHRGSGWARANRRRAEADHRRRVARFLSLAIGVPLLVLLVSAFFFGDRGLWRVAGMIDHRRQLERDIAELQATNDHLRDDVVRLRTDPARIEGIARERLGMGRSGEIVYYFPEATAGDPR